MILKTPHEVSPPDCTATKTESEKLTCSQIDVKCKAIECIFAIRISTAQAKGREDGGDDGEHEAGDGEEARQFDVR